MKWQCLECGHAHENRIGYGFFARFVVVVDFGFLRPKEYFFCLKLILNKTFSIWNIIYLTFRTRSFVWIPKNPPPFFVCNPSFHSLPMSFTWARDERQERDFMPCRCRPALPPRVLTSLITAHTNCPQAVPPAMGSQQPAVLESPLLCANPLHVLINRCKATCAKFLRSLWGKACTWAGKTITPLMCALRNASCLDLPLHYAAFISISLSVRDMSRLKSDKGDVQWTCFWWWGMTQAKIQQIEWQGLYGEVNDETSDLRAHNFVW